MMIRFFSAFVILVASSVNITARPGIPNILIINSYHRGNVMSDNFILGIETQLKKIFPNNELYFEDMDAKRNHLAISEKLLRDRIEYKYSGKVTFDCVLTVDNSALNFVVNNREMYFKNIPVVFCGINDYSPSMIANQKNITGIPEAIDIGETISLILRVHPGVKSIIALTDSTATGRIMLKEFNEAKNSFSQSGMVFSEYSDLSTEELREKLKNGKSDTAILLLTFQKDSTGRLLTFKERTSLLEESRSAVYSCFDYLVGYGVTGGNVISGTLHGRQAAEIAGRIIKGESPDNIPVVTKSPATIMFDYRLMKRFGISESSLPAESVVIHKPFSFYETYRTYLFIVFAIIIILIGIVAFLAINVLQRFKAERALAAERERLYVTIESIGDAVIATDVNGKVILMNKVAEQMTGWIFAEAFDHDLREVFHIINESSRNTIDNPVDLVLRTRKVVELANHTVLISRSGREFIIADSAAPIIGSDGVISGVVLVFRDITIKQRLDESLHKHQRIQSIGFLAGGIAHDFNNYLTGIICNITLMKINLADNPEIIEMLDEAEHAALRATSLTQQLLTFSKGGVPVVRGSYITDLIKENAVFNLRGSKSTCAFDIPDDLWMADVDPGQISQVIANLVINAREAMDGGGEIIIRVRNVALNDMEIPPLKKGKYVKIEIEDQGKGISSEILPHIFDPYFSTKSTGNGLGLAVVYSIIKNHKGHIEAESKNEKGAIFRFFLCASNEDSDMNKIDRGRLMCEGIRVLLMDDDSIVRNSLKRILTSLTCNVTAVDCGEEALEVFLKEQSGENPYKIIIMDLTVPGKMGGKELVKQIRELDQNVKTVVTSGYSNDMVMANFRKYGFDAVLSKPYSLESLHDIMSGFMYDLKV